MGLFSKPKQKEYAIETLRTQTIIIHTDETGQPIEDVSSLTHVGYNQAGEPVYQWQVKSDADRKQTLQVTK
jgi:hypothetical protein